MKSCAHYQLKNPATLKEWEIYHRIKKEEIFEPIGILYDSNHPSIHAADNFHFILYYGENIVTTAHIEILNSDKAALRSCATDRAHKKQGHDKTMMALIEDWLRKRGIKVLKMHARLSAENFYRKLGYTDCIFDDPCIQKNYINLGKVL